MRTSSSGNVLGIRTSRDYIEGIQERFGIENGQNISVYCESNIIPVKLTWLVIEEIRRGFAAGVREPLASAPGFGRFTPNGRSTCYPLSHDEGGAFLASTI